MAEPKAPSEMEVLADRLRSLSNAKRLALLGYLRTPMYLEEIATKLKITRQAAQDHVTSLLEAGLIEKRQGTRETGPVVEYRVVQPQMFALLEDVRGLAATLPDPDEDSLLRTMPATAAGQGQRGDMPELLVLGGLRPGLKATLHRGSAAPPLLLGRDPAAGLPLDWDLQVSNRHAEVRGTAEGHQLVDLFSRNGTLLNGAKVVGGQPVPLRSGDVLQLGRTTVLYRT